MNDHDTFGPGPAFIHFPKSTAIGYDIQHPTYEQTAIEIATTILTTTPHPYWYGSTPHHDTAIATYPASCYHIRPGRITIIPNE